MQRGEVWIENFLFAKAAHIFTKSKSEGLCSLGIIVLDGIPK